MNELTRDRSGRWLLIAVALGLLVALTIAIPTTQASGDVGPVEVHTDEGVLLLNTGSDGDAWVKWYKNPSVPLDLETAVPDKTQTFTFNRCTLTGFQGDDLLSISPYSGDKVALVSNGFGVKNKGNCSTSQGQVNDGQKLIIALGGDIPDGTLIDVAEIDVEGKHNADLDWSVDTGVSDQEDLTHSNDNGPDSGASDNDIARIVVEEGFSSITLSPGGSSSHVAVAIEGGGDGDVPGKVGHYRTDLEVNQTLFHLQSSRTFEGELACLGEATEATDSADDVAEHVSVTRRVNKDVPECDEDDVIAYNLVIEAWDDGGVVFDPNLVGRLDTSYFVRIDWAPHTDPLDPPDRTISLDGGDSYHPVVACEITTLAVPRVPGAEPSPPSADDSFDHPDDAPWCLAGEQQVLLGDGTWQQIQWYDGLVDPNWR
jgi:hypothetical protein